jgi:flavin reductase (DIM6/NTAB) family NADH-FMN oxidoreductase RutF
MSASAGQVGDQVGGQLDGQVHNHVHFDFGELSARDRYKLMIGTVIPRPIAFVTTVDEHGRVNAAPFSFFNCLSADPPIVAIGVENHDDMAFKDTGRNIRHTEEFTVNIVDDAMVEAMNVCAVPFAAGVDELAMAGLTAIPGLHVKCPRIGEAPAALECRRYVTLEVGRSREIILGEVRGIFIREGLVDRAQKYVDQRGMDAIGRMGGHGYTRTRDYFDLPTMSVAQWQKRVDAREDQQRVYAREDQERRQAPQHQPLDVQATNPAAAARVANGSGPELVTTQSTAGTTSHQEQPHDN